jgi:hypothetical protein
MSRRTTRRQDAFLLCSRLAEVASLQLGDLIEAKSGRSSKIVAREGDILTLANGERLHFSRAYRSQGASMSTQENAMNETDLARLRELAAFATGIEYGSEPQIAADNEFHELAECFLSGTQLRELEAYSLKATAEERIAHTFSLLGIDAAKGEA